MRITDLRQGVKNQNRVNVFVDGKYSFSLDIAQVVELGVKVGRRLSLEELAELKRASEFGKMYQRALEWALVRPRSVGELRDYLKRKAQLRAAEERKREWQAEKEQKKYAPREKYDFNDVIVQRLTSKGYVDDRKFAEYYIENRFVKKGISSKRLRMELMKKGVSKDIIEEAMKKSERNDEEEIRKIIAKKRKKYDDEKLINYLARQGFSFELSKKLVSGEEF